MKGQYCTAGVVDKVVNIGQRAGAQERRQMEVIEIMYIRTMGGVKVIDIIEMKKCVDVCTGAVNYILESECI